MDYITNHLEEYFPEIQKEETVTAIASEINIHNITHDDMLNGEGLRVVLWVAGCEHHCAECQNPITWDEKSGIPFTQWEESEFWTWLKKPWTQGATFSGGDPLHPHNRDYIGVMATKIKEEFPEKDIWVYTGYELVYDELHNEYKFRNQHGDTFFLPWLDKIDVLVDGRFEAEVRKNDIKTNKHVLWRGSSNQRIIDIKETLSTGYIALKEGGA